MHISTKVQTAIFSSMSLKCVKLPPIPDLVANFTLTIMMSDSYGDGWNGTILGIRQNEILVGTFESGFTKGLSMLTEVKIRGNVFT